MNTRKTRILGESSMVPLSREIFRKTDEEICEAELSQPPSNLTVSLIGNKSARIAIEVATADVATAAAAVFGIGQARDVMNSARKAMSSTQTVDIYRSNE